jgi:hypothetical protein
VYGIPDIIDKENRYKVKNGKDPEGPVIFDLKPFDLQEM